MTTRRGFLVLGAAAASFAAAPAGAQDRPLVVCVNYPLAWFAGRLAGDLVEVRFPVPAGVDPSFWKPTIADISAVQAADLIVLNGAGFATWTTRTTLPRARTVDTSAGFSDAYIATDTITHSHGAEGMHSHTGIASYTWLDFAQAARQAGALSLALKKLLPEDGPKIDASLAALVADLTALDTEARSVGAKTKGMPIIASHPRYQYLGRAYGLTLSNVEWDAREAATEVEWRALEEKIAETGARMFLWEAEPAHAARDRMSALGVTDTVFPPLGIRPASGDFLSVMRQSLDAFGRAADAASSR